MSNKSRYELLYVPYPILNLPPARSRSTAGYPVSQPDIGYRQLADRDITFEPQQAQPEDHGPGFKIYRWTHRINPSEYLLCRLMGQPHERVISGGFAAGPVGATGSQFLPVHPVQSFPRYPNGWAMLLYNPSDTTTANVYLSIIVAR